MNSITKRWVRGSLFFMLAVLLVAEAIFLYYTVTGYYNGVSDAIRDQMRSIRTQLSLSANTEGSSEEKAVALYRAVEQFEYKARYELMLVHASGVVVSTSSGVLPVQEDIPSDISEALANRNVEYTRFVGNNENGEKVMAITEHAPYPVNGIVAIRLVTSMNGVDGAILNLALASLIFLVIIILAYVTSGLYFIRSIVFPLHNVEATAARIAQGDFDTRIDNNSNDEIGSLCKTINYMAEELGRTERMKNEFISSVSHELRTPLTSIKGWVETVGGMDGKHDANYRRGVEIISSETDRLYDMVEELLDFSRMQDGLQLQCELLDLAAEVEDAVLIVVRRAENLGLLIDYELPELPVPVMADKNRVRQALVNVLDNAIKYSHPGGHIMLTIEPDAKKKNVAVTIADEGQGIAPEDLKNVKLKFFKGKGAARGSGIGLAVVDEVMRAHDGKLDIASEPGKGTRVTLCFPLHGKTAKPKKEELSKSKNAKESETVG